MQTIPIYLEKKLADGVIELIRNELTQLSWLEYTFPAVQIGKNQVTNETFPECYVNDGTYESVRIYPENNIKAFCFFEKRNWNANESNLGLNIYNLTAYFWVNLKLISTLNYNYTDTLVNDVLQILRNIGANNLTVSYDDIFRKFGIDYSKNQLFMFPYSAFKIDFSIRKFVSCI